MKRPEFKKKYFNLFCNGACRITVCLDLWLKCKTNFNRDIYRNIFVHTCIFYIQTKFYGIFINLPSDFVLKNNSCNKPCYNIV